MDELLAFSLALGVSPTELLEPVAEQNTAGLAVTSAFSVPSDILIPWLQGENSTMSVSLLDGFALCKSCRTPVRLRIDGKRLYYFCPNTSCVSPVMECNARYVNEQLAEMCIGILEKENQFYAGFAKAKGRSLPLIESRLAERTSELEDLRVRRAAVVQDIKSLADHPGMNIKTLAGALESFDARIIEYTMEIARLTAELHVIRRDGDLRQQWVTLPAARLREMIAALGTVIIAPECKAEIEWIWDKATSQDGAVTPAEPQ